MNKQSAIGNDPVTCKIVKKKTYMLLKGKRYDFTLVYSNIPE